MVHCNIIMLPRVVKNCPIKSMFKNFQFKIKKQNIFQHSPTLFSFNLILRRLNSQIPELHSFPVQDIKNFSYAPADKSKWCQLIDQISQAQERGKNLPSVLKTNEINELLGLETMTQRIKYLTFLFKKEKKKLAKKQRKQLELENAPPKNIENNHIINGSQRNTLLLPYRRKWITRFQNLKVASSVLFGQNIVIDLSYDDYMTKKEKRDCASQLALVYGVNRSNREPYNLHFCNAKAENDCVRYLKEDLHNCESSIMTLTEHNYLDLFPKENLVYLSPHASETLTTYDHKAVYVIGAFVDTTKRLHISHHKAEMEEIKTYSLPLDEYVLWGVGSKSLSINQAFEIMMTLRDTGDWMQAFKAIPTRKIKRILPEEAEFMSDKIFVIENKEIEAEKNSLVQ